MAAATVAVAHMLQPAIDGIVAGTQPETLWAIGGGILAAFSVKAVANYLSRMLVTRAGLLAISDARNRLFAHVLEMDPGFFSGRPAGALAARFTVDLYQLKVAVSNGVTSLGRDLVSLAGLVGYTVWLDWRMAALAYLVLPLAIWPVSRLGRRIRRVASRTQQDLGRLNARLSQTLRAMRMVRLQGAEALERARTQALIDRLRRLTFDAERTKALVSPLMELVVGVAIGAALFAGGQRVLAGAVTPGELTAFLGALLLAYQPAKRLANLHATVQEGLAAAQRMYALLDLAPAVAEAPDAPPLRLTEGRVRIEDARYTHAPPTIADGEEGEPDPKRDAESSPAPSPAPRRPAALAGVSLDLCPGKVTALVGPSGAGKSTLLNLVPRFFDPDLGRVLIDGQDIRNVTRVSLWRSIALVGQDVVLFDDTLAANIAYARPQATRAEIIEAARQAAALPFIEALPQGFDTPLGERGMRLSGGQRQRLAIARAFLKDAPILLLDEPTAALDPQAQAEVQAALGPLMAGRACLIVAHRLSTVARADHIAVLDGGRVVEEGPPAALLARGGAYARLVAAAAGQTQISPVPEKSIDSNP